MIDTTALKIAVGTTQSSVLLSKFKAAHSLCDDSEAEFLITATHKGLQLRWRRETRGDLNFWIDVAAFANKQKTFPAPRQAGLNQAIGKKSKKVIDATAGWGGDAMLLCAQGLEVVMLERNPLMALLLTDAMERLAITGWARHHRLTVPRVLQGDSIEVLRRGKISADCVYLDPMFTGKRKKSAIANKNMQLLQHLVGADEDAAQLVVSAQQGGYKRIAVKRPDYAQPLIASPNEQFGSKLVHYDVYLNF